MMCVKFSIRIGPGWKTQALSVKLFQFTQQYKLYRLDDGGTYIDPKTAFLFFFSSSESPARERWQSVHLFVFISTEAKELSGSRDPSSLSHVPQP